MLLRPDSPRALNYAELHPECNPLETGYAAIPTADVDGLEDIEPISTPVSTSLKGSLSLRDKWTIVSPLLLKYMLPLCKSSLRGVRIRAECLCTVTVYLVSSPDGL